MSPKCHIGFSFHLSQKMFLGCEEGCRESGKDGLRASSVARRFQEDSLTLYTYPGTFSLLMGKACL